MEIQSMQGKVSETEWKLRVDLAAAYRLVAFYGWTDLVFTHLSARIPGPEHQFLINPYGQLFDEITASSLIRVDQSCNKLHESPFPVNPAGFMIHSAVHAARHDVECVIHTHTRAGIAVSAQKGGLLPISQQASVVMSALSYHDYEGIALRSDEQARLQADLGGTRAMILRNHGLLTVGASVGDAFLTMYLLETACQIQISAQVSGDLLPIDDKVMQFNAAALRQVTAGQDSQIAWPGLLRKLDRLDPGYRN